MTIPTPTELHPRLAVLEAKRTTLLGEKSTKVAEATALRIRIQQSPSNGNAAENRVRTILGEAPLPNTAPDMVRLEQILVELNDLNGAIALLDTAIQKERDVASRLVCDAVRPEVTKRGKVFAKALLDLHAAQLAYHGFLDEIQDAGARIYSLPNVFISGIGDTKDRSGTYFYGMKDLVEAGSRSTTLHTGLNA